MGGLRTFSLSLSFVLFSAFPHAEPSEFQDKQSVFSAIILGDIRYAEESIQSGFDVNQQGFFGDSVLHYAVNHGRFELVKLIISKKPNLEITNVVGSTPLHEAVSRRDLPMVEILILNGANVNAKDRFKNTPLHIATRFGDKEIILFLIEHKAMINEINHVRSTPLDIAHRRNYVEIQKILESAGAKQREYNRTQKKKSKRKS